MADTTARPAVLSAAHCRSRKCPRAGTATDAPRSSSRRPTARNARSPRRHRPNRLANDGSCNRPTATACAGKPRSSRAPHCAAGVAPRRRSRDNAMSVRVNVSWAGCCNHVRGFARFPGMEPRHRRYLSHTWGNIACLGWHCNRGPMDDNVSHGYPFPNAFMTESFGVDEMGPFALLTWVGGKEPT
jgi:hypothetical protein